MDPVDGTANFAAGLPLFGCMAAAIVRGEVVAGWIHDPLGDDTAVALRGEGAWIEAPDGRRHAAAGGGAGAAGAHARRLSWTYLREPLRTRVASRLPRLAGAVGLRCAAHSYRMAASGHLHLLLFNRLLPWDHAAGLAPAPGSGRATPPASTGSPIRPSATMGGLICAPNAACWEEIRAKLLDP